MTGNDITIDVGGWLRGLGLEQYEAAFREHEIDERVLLSLTQDDLKEIAMHVVHGLGRTTVGRYTPDASRPAILAARTAVGPMAGATVPRYDAVS